MNMTYCFDLDGTLCSNTHGHYKEAKPKFERILVVNQLFNAGHRIVIYTARGATTGIDWRELTEQQLRSWGVRYHTLRLDKPYADYFIDDLAVPDYQFFEETLKNEKTKS